MYNLECEAQNGICLIPDKEDDEERGFFIPTGYKKEFPCDETLNCYCYINRKSKPGKTLPY